MVQNQKGNRIINGVWWHMTLYSAKISAILKLTPHGGVVFLFYYEEIKMTIRKSILRCNCYMRNTRFSLLNNKSIRLRNHHILYSISNKEIEFLHETNRHNSAYVPDITVSLGSVIWSVIVEIEQDESKHNKKAIGDFIRILYSISGLIKFHGFVRTIISTTCTYLPRNN